MRDDFDLHNETEEPDSSEFSLESILAEFRGEPRAEEPRETESAARPVVLEADENGVGAASISSMDDLLYPELEPEQDSGSLTGFDPPPARKPEPEPEAGPEPEEVQTSGFDESDGGSVYAGMEYAEMEPEREPDENSRVTMRETWARGFSPASWRCWPWPPCGGARASRRRRRQSRRTSNVPEMQPAKAMRFYAAQQRPLKLRFMGRCL
jgi:hypothetical protein